MNILDLLLILSISSFTALFSVNANENIYRPFPEESEIISQSSDLIKIFSGPKDLFIKKDILILGRPSFAASAEIILKSEYLQIGEEKIYYKDYLACYDNLSCKNKISKIDFLVKDKKDGRDLFFKIDAYENGYAIIHNKNKLYYLKIGYEHFDNPYGFRWRTYVFPSEKDKKIDELFQRTPFLKDFLEKIALCAQKKSIDCLKENSTKEEGNYITEGLQERGVAEDKTLCEKYKKDFNDSGDTSYSMTRELLAKADVLNKSSWESITKATKINLNDTQVIFIINNFDKDVEVVIRNRLPKKMVCWNQEDMLLKMQRINEKWQLIKFRPYDEDRTGLD